MTRVYRVRLTLTPQPEGGYTVTSPALPGFVTEGDSVEAALANIQDALAAAVELYQDLEHVLPDGLVQDANSGVIQFDHLAPSATSRDERLSTSQFEWDG